MSDNWLTRNSQGNPAANVNLRSGVEANPDEAASNDILGRRFGLPAVAIAQDRALFQARARAQDAQDIVFDKPRTQQWLANRPQNAAAAHDDLGVLGHIENAITTAGAWTRDNILYPLASGVDAVLRDETPARISVPEIARQAPKALGSGVMKLLSGVSGVARAAYEADDAVDNWATGGYFGRTPSYGAQLFGGLQRGTSDIATRIGPDYTKVTGTIGRGIIGGLESVPTTAAALGTTVATGNPLLGASVGGFQQGGESYGRARDQGLGVGRSLVYGGIDAVVETGTEFLPEATFLRQTRAGSSVLRRFLTNQLQEQFGEQTATVLQDLNAWATLPENKDKTFGDYLDERPEAALNTAIQTLVVGGVTHASISAIERAADLPAFRARRERTEQALAEGHTQQLQEIIQAAGQSALRERDPASFQDFMEAQTQEGPLEHVYVDGRVLNQTLEAAGPEAQALVDAMPSVREQLAQAVETGGDVRIPTAELATALPGSPIEQSLVDHLRIDPLAQSAAEAKEQAGGALDRLQQGFEEQLGEQAQDAEFARSRDTVTQHFANQLGGANRFTTDVNDRYATLLGSFYSVQAAKLGITPEAMLARYPLQVRAVDEATGAVNRLGQNDTVVNIGLSTAELGDGSQLDLDHVLDVVKKHGGDVLDSAVHSSDSEPTAVLRLGKPLTAEQADAISDELQQEAIAQRVGTEGELYGRQAANWRPFNPDFFVLPNGSRASGQRLDQSSISATVEAKAQQLADQVPGFSRVAPYLTDEELAATRKARAAKLVELFETMPDAEEMASVAYAGRAKRGWYERSALALLDIFGVQDAPRFAGLLAALSPQTSVESNAVNAIKTWVNWDIAGRPTDRQEIVEILGKSVQGGKGVGSVLNAWINNSVTALTEANPHDITLSGPKVNSFMLNLSGVVDEVTNDAWMANYAMIDQAILGGQKDVKTGKKGKSTGYTAMSAVVRRAAEIVSERTGETWTPAEIQETVWSWTKSLYETRDRGDGSSATAILEAGGLTHDVLATTPDFAMLFVNGVYRRVLEFGGYGEQLDAIERSGRADGAPGEEGSVFSAEGSGLAADAFQQHLRSAAERIEQLRNARRGVDEQPAQATLFQGPPAGERLQGLPYRIKVDGVVREFGPFEPAREAASVYTTQAGIAYNPPLTYAKVDEERAKRIAQAFEDMPHDPTDPLVKASYDAMIRETLAQWQAIKATGLKVEFITGADPYGNPRNAILDVVENNHLWVYPTSEGFGGSESADVDISGNPLLATVPGEEISGRAVQANDIFRIVHDYFGHIKEGVGFRADGEENAWRSHSAMYSPLARMAMTTETRGQNSWVNYGPHAEFNKTANGAETQYAPQKIGLLPDWVVNEGAADPSPQPAERVLNNELAAWTPRHIETLIAKAKPNQRVALMSPAQFLGLTASAEGRAALAATRGAELDLDRLQGTTMSLAAPLPRQPSAYQKSIGVTEPITVNLMGHDGRGRMTALARAGIELVPVVINVQDSSGHKAADPADIPAEGFQMAPQRSRMFGSTGDQGTHTGELIELTEANRDRLYALADEARVLFQRTRGYLTFGQDVTAQPSTITLLNASDLSTFLHESGHFFLEVMSHMAAQPGAPQNVVDDMATALKWMGVDGGHAQWLGMTLEQKREFHEKFARGFEAYLFEGKAPSVELRGVFQRFRSWLVSVYKNSIANLRAPLDPEIRGVFDRMIASTEAIRAAEADAKLGPIFTEQPAGMTDVEWQEYQALGLSATAEAIDELQAKSLRDMRFAKRVHARELKRLKAAIAAQREQVEDEVRTEIGGEPVYRAIEFLRRGTINGEPVEGPTKFDVEAFNGLYEGYNEQERETVKKQLGFGKYGMFSRDAGVNPAQVAELFGFTSADELVTALLRAPDLQTEVDAAVEQRMLERYGDINSPEALDAAASAAIHNEVRARFVATELGALSKGVGKPRMLAKAARQYADALVARLKVRDVRPAQYEAAERRAAAAADKAARANDIPLATAEKRNQLLNLYATKAARNAQDEVRKAIDYFRKFARQGTRQNVDPDYLDQIDAMLDRFELRTGVSDKQLAKRKSLAEWIDRQRTLGFEPAIDPDLENEARRQSYRDLTMDELRGLRDSIKNIEHLGRLKRELLKNKEQRELAAAVEAGAAEIRANAYKVKKLPVGARTWLERARSGVDEFFAIHRKFASLIREMSGNQDNSVLWGLFTRPMNEAGGAEAVMTAEATTKLNDIFKRLQKDNTFKRVYEPAIDASISLETRLMVALNWGNATNRSRVMDGDGWTQAQVEAVLAPLTEQHWQFVKDVWSHINSYWPQIAAKEKRVTGVEPEKVEAEPFTFTTSEGNEIVLPGGYFPIKYDPDKSSKADADTAAEVQRQITQGLYTRASTRRGHTKARVDTVERAIRKDFGVVFEHNSQVIHDLAWHETLIDMNRLLGAGQIDEAIREHYGPAVIRVMRKNLEDIAVGGIPAQNVLERGVNYLRAGATVAGLGWNLMTSLFQPLGLTNSIVRIGPQYVGRGIARVFRDAASMEATTTWVYQQSDFMRLRAQTQQREIAEIRQQFQAKGPVRSTLDRVPGVAPTLDVVGGSFFLLITKAQLIADVPTWAGMYEKQIDAGLDHERAVALADQAVIDSQGDGTIKDLAGVQRGGPFQKLWTNFYSWFNVAYNQLAESVNDTRRVGKDRLPLLAVDFLLIAVVPALLTSLLRGAVGGDDWDELKKRVANDQASGYLGFMFGLRELGAAFGVGNGYSGPAGARAIDATIKFGKQAQQGNADEAFFKAANNAAGVLFHYPAGQVQRTWLGIEALADGKTKNPLVILTGPPPKNKH